MRFRVRLRSLLGLVLLSALMLAFSVSYFRDPVWNRTGGMIGWTQAGIESRLGPPDRVFEGDLGDEQDRQIRPAPPGECRTLVFRTSDGQFVARLKAEGGGFVCFGSSWKNRGPLGRYY